MTIYTLQDRSEGGAEWKDPQDNPMPPTMDVTMEYLSVGSIVFLIKKSGEAGYESATVTCIDKVRGKKPKVTMVTQDGRVVTQNGGLFEMQVKLEDRVASRIVSFANDVVDELGELEEKTRNTIDHLRDRAWGLEVSIDPEFERCLCRLREMADEMKTMRREARKRLKGMPKPLSKPGNPDGLSTG